MKTQLLGISLFAATAAAVTLYPIVESTAGTGVVPLVRPADPLANFAPPVDVATNDPPVIEVVFALDTTGSMGGLIEAAKAKIWSIADTMASADPAPRIRMGLVAYRDRGDNYVTEVTDLSDDLDSVYARLMALDAAGGGDGPESVNQALDDAVNAMSWSRDRDTYRVVFLVGDAPAHMDYPDDVKYPQTLAVAARKGIIVNAIQCGHNPATTQHWQRIAHLSQGEFFNVAQDGNAVAVVTPFDEKIARLSMELDETRLFFGSEAEREKLEQKKLDADRMHVLAPAATRARRAAFNASASGRHSFLGDNELVEAVASGRIDLATMATTELPASLQTLAPAEREATVKEIAGRRGELEDRIETLAAERDEFIAKKIEAAGGAKHSLDDKLFGTVRRQAADKGLDYRTAPKY